MADPPDDAATRSRRILSATLVSVGSELTVGDTRDTNSGELARALTARGVEIRRITALPDHLRDVRDAFVDGLARADLVISTGGLGPTPDDLTREAIAAACGETPTVDPALEAWLRDIWRRRDLPFPEINLKQAWRIPSAEALPNPNGTAPGWFVRRPDGRVIVALPGPPREMRPMWSEHVLPRLAAMGLGAETATRTYRLSGIGESQVADLLGDAFLRRTNPVVATYARAEAVDVRISAVRDGSAAAEDLVEGAATTVLDALGSFVWATGETTWSQAIGARLEALGWTLSVVEIGTAGQVAALLGDVPWLRFDETLGPGSPAAAAHGATGATTLDDATDEAALEAFARRGRDLGGSEVGVGVRAVPRTGDTVVSVTVVTPTATSHQRRLVFLDGANGRTRSALTTAMILFEVLGTGGIPADGPSEGLTGAT
jgi:nicotinamide-nucleotide amidase